MGKNWEIGKLLKWSFAAVGKKDIVETWSFGADSDNKGIFFFQRSHIHWYLGPFPFPVLLFLVFLFSYLPPFPFLFCCLQPQSLISWAQVHPRSKVTARYAFQFDCIDTNLSPFHFLFCCLSPFLFCYLPPFLSCYFWLLLFITFSVLLFSAFSVLLFVAFSVFSFAICRLFLFCFVSSEGALYVIMPYDYPAQRSATFWTHTGP